MTRYKFIVKKTLTPVTTTPEENGDEPLLTTTLTITKGTTSASWNHAQNSTDVVYCAITNLPTKTHYMSITDANNVTIYIDSVDLSMDHKFKVLVF